MPPRLLVIESEDDAPVGWLGETWAAGRVRLDTVKGQHGDAIPAVVGPTTSGHDALVVLGGYMGANDDAAAPWLTPLKRLVADTVGQGLPFLGICLGHQLAAVALGGAVAPNPAGRTAGLRSLLLTAEGRADPLLGPADGAACVHYNNDIVTELPSGATVLASTPDGAPQALRLAPRAWSVQFHPEAGPDVVARWGKDAPDGAILRADVTGARERLRSTWSAFGDRFVSLVSRP